ncbi:carboxypeptidase B [Daphnia magna]|uniref:carboxypeptidase B n=1 Tax=Daphnia magna TaxID=35525 RepID=UPI001403E28A|nr:carboxypeptidase B [Daphnia magna]
MKIPFAVLCSSLLLSISVTANVDYSGHVVIRAIPETKDQLELLNNWFSQTTSFLDFWFPPSKINKFVDIRVHPEWYDHVVETLTRMNINHKIHIADIGELVRQEQETIALRRALYSGKAIDLENYHTYEEVMAYLADLANTNPIVSTKVGGTTAEGRDIVQLIISTDLSANKPVEFFECNVHAREWITAATCIWIIDQITTGYGSDPEITDLVDKYDWKFVPIANPDGYAYTWSDDRLWRKNRVFINNSACRGVDINRNFPVGFGSPDGGSDSPCSTTYRGEGPLSELESNTIKDLIVADRGRIRSAISVHSYDQQWLSPYGYSIEYPLEYAEMYRVMEIGVNALTATYGTQYTYGSFANALYLGSGVTTDYYYEGEGILHSYTIELRDLGTYGFVLPPDQIVPTAIETWNGIKAFVNAI